VAVDFERQVLERSRQVPVLVDFWAAWCAPCRALTPVLHRLAAEAAGRWELVQVDTDEQPQEATRWGVRGIPAVKLFWQGHLVAEFVGALPAGEVRRWLDQNLPDPRKERLARIVEGWERQDAAQLVAALEAFASEHPDLAEAKLRLAQAVVTSDPARARRILAQLDGGADADVAADVAVLAELLEGGAAVPDRLVAPLDDARRALAARDWGRALERLIDAVTIDRSFGDELARRAAVALFRLLGHHHELTLEHQRRLAMALHV
jgi:putative thioredoxin